MDRSAKMGILNNYPFKQIIVISILFFISSFGVYDANAFQINRFMTLLPPAIELQTQVGGLNNPIYMTNAGDSRLFIVEQNGNIRILQGNTLLPAPFLNITSLTLFSGERGLLGLTFHPNYPTTPYFFVHFTSNGSALPDGTVPNAGNNVIVRFNVSTGDQNLADDTSGKTLLVIPQPFGNHNGGMIEFGQDGYLYIAKGDGGSGNDPGNRAQNINEILGKILRLDVNINVNTAPYHGIPPTNPFAGATPGRDEIFAIGLRNPWRFSFDRMTGDMWIGDVGEVSIEEIDFLQMDTNAPGSNFGWRIYEGNTCTNLNPCNPPAKYVAPAGQYSHSGGRCSITGGYVYRGTQIPSLVGSYVYADYCTGEIFRLQGGTQELMLDTPHNISSFGEDNLGELYVTAIGGQLYKIRAVVTAASVNISGRVTTQNGRGVRNAFITLDGGQLNTPLVTRTNQFGYYVFRDIEVGETYTLSATSKRYDFTPHNRVISLSDDVLNADFIAIPFR